MIPSLITWHFCICPKLEPGFTMPYVVPLIFRSMVCCDCFLFALFVADFIQGLLKIIENKLARSFNFTLRYLDDVHSLNNSRFGDFIDRIYPIELEIKDTTDTEYVCFISWPTPRQSGAVKNETVPQKRLFKFSHCQFDICSIISAAPAYGVYISQLIRFSRDCGSYHDFHDRRNLLNQGFLLAKLKSSLRKFCGRHHDLVDLYGIYVPLVVNTSRTFPH